VSVTPQDGGAWINMVGRKLNALERAMGRDRTPAGTVIFGAWAYPPSGYVLADGGTHLIEDLPRLFAAIEHRFGGSGASFQVPSVAAPSGLVAVVKT
jgi:hypothetical protein